MPKWAHLIWKKPTNVPKPPSNQAEVEKRLLHVEKLLIQSYSRGEIVLIIQKAYWISVSQVDRYIKQANVLIRAKNAETLEWEFNLMERQIMGVYQGAIRDKKYGDAARALKLKMELRWLEQPKKILVGELTTMREEELEEYGDEGLSDNEKTFLQELTWLTE